MAMNEEQLMAMQQQDPQRAADQQNIAAGDPTNQMPPEMMAQMMAGAPQGDPMGGGQSPDGMGFEGGPPLDELNQEAPMDEAEGFGMEEDGMNAVPDSMMGDVPEYTDPLKQMILDYIDFAVGIKQDGTLNKPIAADILGKMASAVATLVPLVSSDQETELQVKHFELQLKAQEHQMMMEMKQQEMELKKAEMEMKMQFDQQSNQLKLQQQNEVHQHKLVQGQENHQTKIEQQKQAAQLKQNNKPVK